MKQDVLAYIEKSPIVLVPLNILVMFIPFLFIKKKRLNIAPTLLSSDANFIFVPFLNQLQKCFFADHV